MRRHRRELFSPHPLRRLAALGYLKSHPSVDDLPLLRDYLTWEERPLLRKRASAILSLSRARSRRWIRWKRRTILNLPNAITSARILAAPV